MAKEQKTKPEPEPVAVTEEMPQPPRSYRIHILLGMVIIALAETTFLFFLLPSQKKLRDELIDIQDIVIDNDTYQVPIEVVPPTDLGKKPLVEKPLGDKFKVQSIRSGPEQITDVFSVIITVQILKKDETAYDKLYAERQNAIRDAVTVVLRASTLEDRNQVALLTIKRNVKKAINEVLGISYVQGILCTEPSVEMI
jgi:flagellar basal body-associated protein FliL